MINADEENQNKREREEEANAEEGKNLSKIPRKEEANPENEEMEVEEKESAIALPEEEENIHTSTNFDQYEAFLDTEINNANSCLNTLAWLLEYDAASCTAVCIVKGNLLISDNTISLSTQADNKQLQYIDSIIQYFSRLMAEGKISEERKVTLEEKTTIMLKEICLRKIKGHSKGNIRKKFDKDAKQLEKIVTAFLSGDKGKLQAVKKSIGHSSEIIDTAVGICDKVTRRFKRVEDFLLKDAKKEEKETQSNSLIRTALRCSGTNALEKRMIRLSADGAADYHDRDWLTDTEKKEYGILAVNIGTVHAELKIIDYLLASRIITSDIDDKTSYYIGISKTCCSGCYGMANLVNTVLDKKVFTVADTHGQEPKQWYRNLPIFLLQAKEKMEEILAAKAEEKKKATKTKGKKKAQNKTEEETSYKTGEKESEETAEKEVSDEKILLIKKGLKYAERNEAEGYVAVFDNRNKEIEAKRVSLKSLNERDVAIGKISEQNKKNTVKAFLLRDYELLIKICNRFIHLLETDQFHIYEEKKSMSHPSPARPENEQIADYTTDMTLALGKLKGFLGKNPTHAGEAVAALLEVKMEMDGVIKFAQELEKQNNTSANTPSSENLAQSSASSLSAGTVEKKQESIGNLNFEYELPIAASASMQEPRSDNTSKDALLPWNNSPSGSDLDNPIQATQKNQEL